MFGVSIFRPSRQSNISTSGEEIFKYPLLRENKISQMTYPRDNKDNQQVHKSTFLHRPPYRNGQKMARKGVRMNTRGQNDHDVSRSIDIILSVSVIVRGRHFVSCQNHLPKTAGT